MSKKELQVSLSLTELEWYLDEISAVFEAGGDLTAISLETALVEAGLTSAIENALGFARSSWYVKTVIVDMNFFLESKMGRDLAYSNLFFFAQRLVGVRLDLFNHLEPLGRIYPFYKNAKYATLTREHVPDLQEYKKSVRAFLKEVGICLPAPSL